MNFDKAIQAHPSLKMKMSADIVRRAKQSQSSLRNHPDKNSLLGG
jgi:hypothetical protein